MLGFKIKIEFCGKFTFLAESTETLNIECINIARVEMDRERVRDREIELDHYIIEYKLENVGTRQVRIMFFLHIFFCFSKKISFFFDYQDTNPRYAGNGGSVSADNPFIHTSNNSAVEMKGEIIS